jgi:genome maintenance exonuclease 1
MSLVITKYNYAKLSRTEFNGARRYLTPDGSAVASVTTILSETSDKSHLIAWRNRIGHAKAKEITTEAAGVGTRMHKYLEDFIVTGEWPTPGSNPYAIKAHAMATVIRDQALVDMDEIWGTEVSLYVPKIYAGTTDLVGKYKKQPCIGDFKQSNKLKKPEWVSDYRLQMVAYADAHNAVHGTNIREGHIFMCTRDLEYQQFDVWPNEFDDWRHEWYERVHQFYTKTGG